MRTMFAESQTGDANTFPFSLLDFCVTSVRTCFSAGADRLCVPIALSAVSVLLSLLSCFLLVYQRCTVQRGHPGESITLLYSLLGNVCSTLGAIMSRQLHIQVLMGFSAAGADVVSFISCCLRVLLCWNSKAERRLRMMRWRRRQHILAVCMLMVVTRGFLSHLPADRPLSGSRKLLHVTLQDNTEILGYILGLLSFIIACTSRLPALLTAYKGQRLTRASVFSGLLCSLAAALYAAAVLLYDTHFDFLLKVMPWLLSAICCVILDLLIVVMRLWRSGTRKKLIIFPPDTKSLLGVPFEKTQRKQQVNSSRWTKAKNVQKMSEMGHYMDVSVHPAGKQVRLKELLFSKEKGDEKPLNSTLPLMGVSSLCSSDTSCDSSVVSSDLEWDFEEANAQWRETTAKQQEEANLCSCAMLGFPQRTLSAAKEG